MSVYVWGVGVQCGSGGGLHDAIDGERLFTSDTQTNTHTHTHTHTLRKWFKCEGASAVLDICD